MWEVVEVGQDRRLVVWMHAKPVHDRVEELIPGCGGHHTATAVGVVAPGEEVIRVPPKYLAAVDRATEHKVVATPAVIGAAAIGGEGAAKVGLRDDGGVVPHAHELELLDEGVQSVIDVVKLIGKGAEPIVRVEARQLDVKHLPLFLQLFACLHEAGDLVQLLRELFAPFVASHRGSLVREGLVGRDASQDRLKLVGVVERLEQRVVVCVRKDRGGLRLLDATHRLDDGLICTPLDCPSRWVDLHWLRVRPRSLHDLVRATERVRACLVRRVLQRDSVDHPAKQALCIVVLRVQALGLTLLPVVREEQRRDAGAVLLARALVVLLSDRLDEGADVGDECAVAVGIEVAQVGHVLMQPKLVARLALSRRVDLKKLVLGHTNRRARVDVLLV